MSKKLNNVAGGIASVLATNTLGVRNRNASHTTVMVQSQHVRTVNTYLAASTASKGAFDLNTHHLFRQK